MSYGLQFGTFSFPKGFHVASVDMARSVPAAKLPRADGARVIKGYLEAKKITVRGGVYHAAISTGGAASVRSQLDTIKGALAQGPAAFYTDSDRYYRNCQSASYSDTFDPTEFNRIVTVQFELISGDPFSYEVANQNAGGAITASGQTQIATNNGNAYAQPQISVTMGTTGSIAATITNTTTGEAFTLGGAVTAGDVIIVDSLQEAVTRSGVDVTSLFDGQFPRLLPGANTFQVQYTSGTVTNLAIAFNQRWY